MKAIPIAEVELWPPYPDRPTGSTAVIRPGRSSSLTDGYVCTVLHADDPILPILRKQISARSDKTWTSEYSGILTKRIYSVKLLGRVGDGPYRGVHWRHKNVPAHLAGWIDVKVYPSFRYKNSAFKLRPGDTYSDPMQNAINTSHKVDPKAPTELGFRHWKYADGYLISPQYTRIWLTPEMRGEVDFGNTNVEGNSGVHAERMPVDPDKFVQLSYNHPICMSYNNSEVIVWGVVERFGDYILGEKGWRAEWVMIRTLYAPNNKIGQELERTYPEVRVRYLQENGTWT